MKKLTNTTLILVLGYGIMIICFIISCSIGCWTIFQRSGPILIVSAVLLDRQTKGSKAVVLTSILGTAVWGYGDLI